MHFHPPCFMALDAGVSVTFRGNKPIHPTPLSPAISLERFEARDPVLSRNSPIMGQLHYEVQRPGGGPWCVQMDYHLGHVNCTAWAYPDCPLWGKGMIDVQFDPIDSDSTNPAPYKGPVVLFVRLLERSTPQLPDSLRPISTTCATMVDLI